MYFLKVHLFPFICIVTFKIWTTVETELIIKSKTGPGLERFHCLSLRLKVIFLSLDCFELVDGKAVYTGTTSVTATGRVCQRWDSQVPHDHNYCCTKVSSADENYCRNPDDWTETWCMTSDPAKEWEKCAVPNCGK